MELRHLRYFLAIAEELNFSRAAERLHISQPPLSRQIRDLATELGVVLFDRTGRQLKLTAAGLHLKTEGGQLLDTVTSLRRRLRQIGGQDKPSLRIGYVASLMLTILPDLLVQVKKQHPNLMIEVSEMYTEAQVAEILAGRLDIGLVRSWGGSEKLNYDRLGEESLSVIYPTSFFMANPAPRTIADLASFPFIAFRRSISPGLAAHIDLICERSGFVPQAAYEINQIYSAHRLVEASLGWSVVPVIPALQVNQKTKGSILLPDCFEFGITYRPGLFPEIIQTIITTAKLNTPAA